MAAKANDDNSTAQSSGNAQGKKTSRCLVLLRHAKSSWGDASIPDKERPLAPRGRKAAKEMRRLIRSKRIKPDLVLVSPARRTMETIERLKLPAKSVNVAQKEELYLASGKQLIDILRGVDGTVRSILLVGHNPGLQELAVALLGQDDKRRATKSAKRIADNFPTCALATFKLRCPWSQLGEGQGRLRHFIRPRDL